MQMILENKPNLTNKPNLNHRKPQALVIHIKLSLDKIHCVDNSTCAFRPECPMSYIWLPTPNSQLDLLNACEQQHRLLLSCYDVSQGSMWLLRR